MAAAALLCSIVCMCVCVRACCCLLVVQGRQARFTWSRLLLCPLLSLWESFPLERGRYSFAPRAAMENSETAVFLSRLNFSSDFTHSAARPPFYLPHSQLLWSLIGFLICFFFFFLYLHFSEPVSPSTVSLASPSLSVCSNSSAIWMCVCGSVVSIHK